MTQSRPEKPLSETRQSIRTCIIAQAMGSPLPQVLINGGILSLFIIALGGSKLAVGSVFTVNYLGQLVRVLAAPHIDVAHPKKFVLRWFTLSTLLFAGIFLTVPILSLGGRAAAVWYVVGLFALQRLATNIGAQAWLPLLSEIIPDRLRGRFFGRMRATFQTVSLILMVIIGWYLGAEPSPLRFQLVFAVLFAMSIVRPLLLRRLPNPPPNREGPRIGLLQNLFTPLKDRGWRQFILFWCALAFSFSLGRPFIVPFLKEDLGFPSSVTAYASGALLLGMILGLTPWGRLADRMGNRVVLLANILILSGAFLLLSITPHYARSAAGGIIVAMSGFSLIGLAVGGLGIGHTVRQMYAAPRSSRSSYMAVFFMANGLVGAITSVLAGAMLDHFPASISLAGLDASPIRLFFVLVSLLVLTSAILLWNLDPVAEKPIQIAVHDFLCLLPPTLTYPLRIVDLDPHVRVDASQPASEPPEGHS